MSKVILLNHSRNKRNAIANDPPRNKSQAASAFDRGRGEGNPIENGEEIEYEYEYRVAEYEYEYEYEEEFDDEPLP